MFLFNDSSIDEMSKDEKLLKAQEFVTQLRSELSTRGVFDILTEVEVSSGDATISVESCNQKYKFKLSQMNDMEVYLNVNCVPEIAETIARAAGLRGREPQL